MRKVNNDRDPKRDGALIRIASEADEFSYIVCQADAERLIQYALLAAEQAASERLMVSFVRDQINGRDPVIEAAISKAHPGYLVDVNYKVTIFALALIFMRSDLSLRVQAVLTQRECAIVIQLNASDVHVRLEGNGFDYEVAYLLDDPNGEQPKLH